MKRILSICLIISLVSSCSNSVSTDLDKNEPDKLFSSLLQENIDDSFGSMPGVSIAIHSPLLENNWNGAAGFADDQLNEKLETGQVFRIASVTKTFVAAAILRLHEMDSLSIDQPISDHVDQSIISILESDGYNPEQILIKHCLNHTSGLADYAMATEYINEMINDPRRTWTRKQQLEGAMKWGDKLGEPGEQTQYCDTGYIILGAIIEKFFKGDLAKGLRELLKFERLGLKNTWLENLEEHSLDDSNKVHRYHGKFETTEWDASIDLYGGGGLVSNTEDLAIFFFALFNNKIYTDPTTLELMSTVPDYIDEKDGNDRKDIKFYNYGFWTVNIFGNEVFMHNGFWCTTVLYIPKYNTSIAVNATRGTNDRMIKKVLMVLEQLNNKQ